MAKLSSKHASIPKETLNEIKAYFDNYADAFSSYDFKAVRNLWSLPGLVISNKKSITLSDSEDFLESCKTLDLFCKSVGMAKMQKMVDECHEIAPETISIVTNDRMFNEEGDTIVSWEQTYILQRINEQWKAIATISTGEVTRWATKGTALAAAPVSSNNIYLH